MKVAVIAVHGVADQKPKASAREVANILADFTGSYSGFVEREIRVPLKPVLGSGERRAEKSFRAEVMSIQEQSVELRSAGREGSEADEPFEHAFMRSQLSEYEQGEDRVFETIRLEATRTGETTVHVYEAYWADLSRIGSSVVTFFAELYQLLLHLPSLGRTVINGERALRGDPGPWRFFAFCQRWLVRSLTLFIAPLNLVLLTLALPLLATQMDVRATVTLTFGVVVALAALALLAGTGLVLRRLNVPGFVWLLAPFATALIGASTAAYVADISTLTHVLMFEVWLISALLVGFVLKSFNERRPGALLAGGSMLLVAGAWLIARLLITERMDFLPGVAVRVMDVANLALQLGWRFHWLWFALTLVAAAFCLVFDRKEIWRAVRAAWIGIVSVGLATVVFANLTLAFWAALLKAATGIIPRTAPYAPLRPRFATWLEFELVDCAKDATVGCWIDGSIGIASRGFVFLSVVLALFFVALVWSIFPSILVEASPPRPQSGAGRMTALGQWLSNGFMVLPWAALLVPAGFFAIKWLGFSVGPAAVAAAGGAMLVILAARIWLPGASGALDVALDVDNYLREHPRRSTPRARIAERFASLIDFIRNPRMSGHDYDATVIIAHSQGSVITADLLRFLKHDDHPVFRALAQKPVLLFTMGCPLRQLYARIFSPLYQWMETPAGVAKGPRIPDDAAPDPRELGLDCWVNAYRSGDYVGRNVWSHRDLPDVWKRRREDPQDGARPDLDRDDTGLRREMCIGEGAHTHYWDRTSRDIGLALDDLILEATAAAARHPSPPPHPPSAREAEDSTDSGE